MAKYRILSLDGGGSWALIQARVLKDIYGDIQGHQLLKQFDMVIANSGGALVLACLCNNMTLSETINLFDSEQTRKKIFSGLTLRDRLIPRNMLSIVTRIFGFGPKYRASRKLEGLYEVFKEQSDRSGRVDYSRTELKELPAIIGKPGLQIIIVGFDYFKSRVSFFRSNATSNTNKFSAAFTNITLAHAIHASSNAPVNYFDAPATLKIKLPDDSDKRSAWFWDGAVAGFNNPVLAGLIEAMTNNAVNPVPTPLEDHYILSIGTGTGGKAVITDYQQSTNPVKRSIYEKNLGNPLANTDNSLRFLNDVKKISTSILSDPPDSATFIAYAILDPTLKRNSNIVRINPCLAPELNQGNIFDVPTVYSGSDDEKEKFKTLLTMDMDAIKEYDVKLIMDLCNKYITDSKPCLPNQLIRGESNGSTPILGQPTYREAKAKWMEYK